MRAKSWLWAVGVGIPGAVARAEEATLPGAYRTIGLGVVIAVTMVGSVIGAAWAVARIGTAVMGAAAERPEILTRSLVYVALAEGLAVLGFALSVMLLQKL